MHESQESSGAPAIPKDEHPRPDFYRKQWLSLNGEWDFAFEDISLNWRERSKRPSIPQNFGYSIVVPFCHQSELAGLRRKSDGLEIGADHRNCEVLWYHRSFAIPQEWQDKRILLHFEAIDYEASVWLNGQFLGFHRGGHVPFVLDLGVGLETRTPAREYELVVRVYDPLDPAIPRGKQAWESPAACWYIQCSGIWQSVWLEAVSETYIQGHEVRCQLNGDNATLHISVESSAPAHADYQVEAQVRQGETPVVAARVALTYPQNQLTLAVPEPELWSPEHPNLYDLDYRIYDAEGKLVDEVHSYVGIRSVALSRKSLLLNGSPYYQRLVLDQGFWPDGRYTAPSDAALRHDIELAKAAGFNGCRKHMKVEEARFLYWADKLGFLVWGEFPAPYVFNAEAQRNFLLEWPKAIERDRLHPSIVAWVPYNESWGIAKVSRNHEQQAWVRSVYELTRRLDPERPVIDNDGWEHVVSDIYTYHTYVNRKEELAAAYQNAIHRSRCETPEQMREKAQNGTEALGLPLPLMADGMTRPDMPILISEFGGIGYLLKGTDSRLDSWGYNGMPETEAEFKARFEEIMESIYDSPELCGFCYTQLTDVDQEMNGILTFERNPKIDLAYFQKWFGRTKKN